jgi:hypothetical protein
MGILLRSVLVLFAMLGTVQAATAHPKYTIYVDTSQRASTDSGMISSDCDVADQNAR